MWEETDCCANKYRCVLDIYLMNVLLYLYGITMDCGIKSPDHEKMLLMVLILLTNIIE